ncbi:MAG: transposase [Anaerolineales bacterium]|nr:transposase [Anaerolineales bacterium]
MVRCPLVRRRGSGNGVDVRLKAISSLTAREFGAAVLALAGMPDHGQLLRAIVPQFGVQRLVGHGKGRASRFFAPGILVAEKPSP